MYVYLFYHINYKRISSYLKPDVTIKKEIMVPQFIQFAWREDNSKNLCNYIIHPGVLSSPFSLNIVQKKVINNFCTNSSTNTWFTKILVVVCNNNNNDDDSYGKLSIVYKKNLEKNKEEKETRNLLQGADLFRFVLSSFLFTGIQK